jgi:hypothetical protein
LVLLLAWLTLLPTCGFLLQISHCPMARSILRSCVVLAGDDETPFITVRSGDGQPETTRRPHPGASHSSHGQELCGLRRLAAAFAPGACSRPPNSKCTALR